MFIFILLLIYFIINYLFILLLIFVLLIFDLLIFDSYNIKFYRISYYLNILINVSNIGGAKTDKTTYIIILQYHFYYVSSFYQI